MMISDSGLLFWATLYYTANDESALFWHQFALRVAFHSLSRFRWQISLKKLVDFAYFHFFRFNFQLRCCHYAHRSL